MTSLFISSLVALSYVSRKAAEILVYAAVAGTPSSSSPPLSSSLS